MHVLLSEGEHTFQLKKHMNHIDISSMHLLLSEGEYTFQLKKHMNHTDIPSMQVLLSEGEHIFQLKKHMNHTDIPSMHLFLSEGEYTFQLKKPRIPLMMERGYKPDGWLGMLMGTQMYVNFDGKYEFDYAFNLLLDQLNRTLSPDGEDDTGIFFVNNNFKSFIP